METLLYLFIFLFGTAIGSFLNVVAVRYIKGESIHGRSHCPKCGKTLRWWELIPIISFIVLRGRCVRCHTAFSIQYILMEVITGLLFMLAFHPIPQTIYQSVSASFLVSIVCILLVLFLIDFYTFLLPDAYIIGLSILSIAWLAITPSAPTLFSSFMGMLSGAGFLLVLWVVTRGKGIGLGDVKLLLPLGALLGMSGVLVLLWIAFSTGGIIGLYLLLRGKAHLKTALPFGPFLTATAMLLLLFPHITERVLSVVTFK